jgi:alkylation response protein AidB-like acyl-CoA dehydrogenase
MPFFQTPPTIDRPFEDDRLLRALVARKLPGDVRAAVEPELREMAALASGELARLQEADVGLEPRLVQWDAWGHRIDRIEVTPLWKRAEQVAAEKGLVATAYERRHREHARLHQFALVYLFDPATDVYTCPLAMTDGAAKTLTTHRNQLLLDRALPRLTSRDPRTFWTSGQWMTERTGGSDVAISETVAKQTDEGFRLYGTKWFTSATTSQMALTLARPEGNPPGGSGLALFYLETRDEHGRLRDIQVNRLKDKLGTRKVPTAELTLDGVLATPVVGLTDGVKHITPMLSITRTWNAICAVAGMRRMLVLARDYAKKRVAFGAPLAKKALHVDTLAGMAAEYEGAFLLAFRAAELLGREEAGVLDDREAKLLRLVTPLAKLTTGKQAVALASETLESFGGAGYIEDTGLPRILRDAQVLSIWEGTTNVLSLDVLRALARGAELDALAAEVEAAASHATPELEGPARDAVAAVAHARAWLAGAASEGRDALERGARRFALTLGRAWELALLVEHAAWTRAHEGDLRDTVAARRFARHGVDLLDDLDDLDAGGASSLANDEPLAV